MISRGGRVYEWAVDDDTSVENIGNRLLQPITTHLNRQPKGVEPLFKIVGVVLPIQRSTLGVTAS